MRHPSGRVVAWVGYALLAFILTLAVGGVWAALLAVNLATTPACHGRFRDGADPLAALAVHGWGGFAPERRRARRRDRRANPVPPPVFAWALLAGALSIIA